MKKVKDLIGLFFIIFYV